MVICEYTNNMIRFTSYVFSGSTESLEIEDAYSAVDVMGHAFVAFMVLIMFSWWVIPLRKAGACDKKFTCDKKE